MQSIINSYFR